MTLRKIILLRRDHADIAEMDALQLQFPDDDLQYIRTDPADHLEHDALCRQHGAELVLLPKDKPIPTTAMARGVKHLTLMPDGKLMQLISFTVVVDDL